MTDTQQIDTDALMELTHRFKHMYHRNLNDEPDLKCSTMDALSFVTLLLSGDENYDTIDDTGPREAFLYMVREHVLKAQACLTYFEDDYVAIIIDGFKDVREPLIEAEIDTLQEEEFTIALKAFYDETWRRLVLEPGSSITWTNRGKYFDVIWKSLKPFVRNYLDSHIKMQNSIHQTALMP